MLCACRFHTATQKQERWRESHTSSIAVMDESSKVPTSCIGVLYEVYTHTACQANAMPTWGACDETPPLHESTPVLIMEGIKQQHSQRPSGITDRIGHLLNDCWQDWFQAQSCLCWNLQAGLGFNVKCLQQTCCLLKGVPCGCMKTNIHIPVHIHIHMHIYMHIYAHIHLHIHIPIHMPIGFKHIHTSIHIHTHAPSLQAARQLLCWALHWHAAL